MARIKPAKLPFGLRCRMSLVLLIAGFAAPFSEKVIRRHSMYLSRYIATLDTLAAIKELKETISKAADEMDERARSEPRVCEGTPEAMDALNYIGEVQSTDEPHATWIHRGSRLVN